MHVLVLVAVAVFYGVELARGEGSSTVTVVMSGLLILAFAALLALLARAWFVGSPRAAVPTFVWNGLLIPVVVALYGAEETLIATGVLVDRRPRRRHGRGRGRRSPPRGRLSRLDAYPSHLPMPQGRLAPGEPAPR